MCGEIYETTVGYTYSNWDDKLKYILVPEKEKLMFRSFQPYEKDAELALFFWLERKTTVCLVCADEAPSISLKHIPWEERDK
jgi:hypothetical protein